MGFTNNCSCLGHRSTPTRQRETPFSLSRMYTLLRQHATFTAVTYVQVRFKTYHIVQPTMLCFSTPLSDETTKSEKNSSPSRQMP